MAMEILAWGAAVLVGALALAAVGFVVFVAAAAVAGLREGVREVRADRDAERVRRAIRRAARRG